MLLGKGFAIAIATFVLVILVMTMQGTQLSAAQESNMPTSNQVNTTFVETGLPVNTVWSVAYANLSAEAAAHTAITFTAPSNTYAFTVFNVTLGNAFMAE